MKKGLLIVLLFSFFTTTMFAQVQEDNFPFSKLLKMTHKELLAAKFKYNDYRNEYRLTKKKGADFLGTLVEAAFNTITTDTPDKNDYYILIQGGMNKIASIEFSFWDKNIYNSLLKFGKEKGTNFTELHDDVEFKYKDYTYIVTRKKNKQSQIYESGDSAIDVDESYISYELTIKTNEDPFSEYLIREKNKAVEKQKKGKKSNSLSELM